ncbi:GNAT family N-acetyltransferase [Rossellomorea aquimaris]|uniref:GNAT family N-acetyltransferase n=1 Tax=Rossellomorea aquimaris TaxID=189382 RepID=UPI001CD355C7|nr:GNAT family N-acetyltransferase [Rossellomorea aquimaris]MCA1054493.1 GNAT family N-acetyltransferase [Rossellomorea aquimaris]
MERYRLTGKVKKLIAEAERIAERKNHRFIQSVDLFIGASQVKEGTLLEMHHLVEENVHLLDEYGAHEKNECGQGSWPFSLPLSAEARTIWMSAVEIMKRYNQIYLNEGHVLKAFFRVAEKEESALSALRAMDYEKLYQTVTAARDLIVYLPGSEWNVEKVPSVNIRQASTEDREDVVSFVRSRFGEEWGRTIQNGFSTPSGGIPIFIAEEDGELIGFAAFDVYLKKKGVYGPMGVIPEHRESGVGKKLLYAALNEMKNQDYMYAVLKEAGPVEFYEKVCDAKLIPL